MDRDRIRIPPERIRRLNDRPERSRADYVLYWVQMYHRAEQNWALTAAIEEANRLALPVVAYQGLGHTYPQANDRLHRFILEGVAELPERFARRGIRYHFYLRQRATDPNDLLYRLAQRAALVVTDDFPAFFIPDQTSRVAGKLDVAMSAVDSNGIVPLAAIPGEQYGAYTLRPRIRRLLPDHLGPVPEPLVKRDSLNLRLDLPHTQVARDSLDALIAGCTIDHDVRPSSVYRGGYREARERLARFIAGPLDGYGTARNQPGAETTSRLSPYLHFGQISPQEVALAVRDATGAPREHRDAFLEELIVRRELGYNFCRFNPNHRTLDALPAWAKATLSAHAADPRPYLYAPEDFENAKTHDYLWNAIQAELLTTGLMFGYYRMYWGKKIIEWSRTPGRRAGDHDRPARKVCPGRPECQHLQQHPLVFRQARPPLVRASGVRQGALYVARRDGDEDQRRHRTWTGSTAGARRPAGRTSPCRRPRSRLGRRATLNRRNPHDPR